MNNGRAREASLGPIRGLGDKVLSTPQNNIRPIHFQDFMNAIQTIRPSVSPASLKQYESWNKSYGSTGV